MCTFLGVKWCTIVAFVILSKTFLQNLSLSQVVGKNVFGQSICRVCLIFDMLKTIWKPMYFMISNTYFQSMLF